MKQIRMPENVRGEWIWKGMHGGADDVYLLARKTLHIAHAGLDYSFWIAASCSYALFINERLCGFGPRAGHGDACYADCYDVGGLLLDGVNTFGVVVYSSRLPDAVREPGFWCQLESGGETLLMSNGAWDVCEAKGLTRPRPRAGRHQLMTEYCDFTRLPDRWLEMSFQPDAAWSKPDRCRRLEQLGWDLKPYPLAPAAVDSFLEFSPLDHGTLQEKCAWTQVVFGDRHENCTASCAAECYLFSEAGETLRTRLYADDPLKIFCDNRLLFSAERSDGELVELKLRAGWNRLLVIQTPCRNSMGVFFLFPELGTGSVSIFQQPDESSPPLWTVAGPLKMPLADATASLRLERLETESYMPNPSEPVDMDSLLRNAGLQFAGDGVPGSLRAGEFVRYRLNGMRYGFPVVELEAAEGDIVDLSFGYKLAGNGVPSRGEGGRATHTVKCRRGLNRFLSFNPREGVYLMLSARRAEGDIRIVNCGFEELLRTTGAESSFSCSDELFNDLWRIGAQTLRRSSAFVPQIESHAEYDNYLLDAYIDAVNMVCVLGGRDYSALRLRQFIEAQFENGDIPVLTFSRRYRSQAHQLFFLPVWLLYNYRLSGDIGELRSFAPTLESLWRFYRSLLDEEAGLIGELRRRFQLKSRLGSELFEPESFPTDFNALYCRFLLSSAEVFRAVGRKKEAEECLAEMREVAGRLRQANYLPEKKLFAGSSRDGRPDGRASLWGNLAALLGGVMPAADLPVFLDHFFRADLPFDRDEAAADPYFNFLFLETLFALEQCEWGKRYFREYWRRRADIESESWRSREKAGEPAPLRFFDGNVVSPNVFLVREIAGVRVAGSGHTAVYFNPAVDQADWAKLSLPTAFGRVKVHWAKQQDGSLNVLIDANYPMKVLPEMSAEQLKNTAFELGSNVTLLAPPELTAEAARAATEET